ncbi:MAG: muconolactone Delta-isomerase family protein [Bacteroidia bacterium]
MNQYLVDLDLPLELNEEFILLVPEQRQQIDELMANGIILSYALAADRSKVWATINAETVEEVQEILHTMPLIHFMEPTIYELEFYNATGNGLPAISLN